MTQIHTEHDEGSGNTHPSHGHAGHGSGVEGDQGARLLGTLLLNFMIPAAQIVGGVYAQSVALLSDAVHNLSDFTAVLIAYIAYRLGNRGASARNTFGYRRAEVMGALINVVLLLAAAVFILWEAFDRFLHPQPVLGGVVVALAGVGILGNGFSALLLHKGSKHSLNIRGAFLHMLGDLLTSVLVLVNGLVLLYRPWYWLDPLLSLLIVAFILRVCWGILKEATAILMNATPAGIRLSDVRASIESIPGVQGVHYLHAWKISSGSTAFSCHVQVPDQPLSETEKLRKRIHHALFDEFGIDHPVIQLETGACGNGGMLCEISCGGEG